MEYQKISRVSALAVANQFVELGQTHKSNVTPMKLLKLVYMAHGWSLAIGNGPLLDGTVEAWKYGPVVDDVYRMFKRFGADKIDEYATCRHSSSTPDRLDLSSAGQNAQKIIERVWCIYGKLDGPQLMMLTHQPGTPWHTVWHEQGGRNVRGTDIPDQLIKEHFVEKIREKKART